VGDDQPAGAAVAQFRLGDLWRRRLDPRTHPFHHRPHPERDPAVAGRASDLRRRLARRDRYHEVGVRHIVALRGDPAAGIGTAYAAHPDGYQTSADLVAGIRKRHPDIEVSVSAYPEKHPESPDFDADIDTLQAKVDAGAARAITQVFFDNDLYFRYLDRVRARGIEIPIVPGIMPMHNFKQARNFVTRAGTSVPGWLAEKFDGLDDDAETRKLVAATVAAGQVQKLAKHGVDTFHFYTMNRADLVFAISHLLGIRPQGAQKAA
jgi:methylenetetrahydrofolate reductase (NADPH)